MVRDISDIRCDFTKEFEVLRVQPQSILTIIIHLPWIIVYDIHDYNYIICTSLILPIHF